MSEDSMLRARIGSRWVNALSLDYGGVVIGLVFLAFSLTPSLLPRPQASQGVISGLSFAIGYGLGVALWALTRRLVPWRHTLLRQWGWPVLGILLVTGAVILAPFVVAWQNGIRTTVGLPTIPGYSWVQLFAVALAVALVAMALGRGLRLAYQRAERRSGPLVRRVTGPNASQHERTIAIVTDVTSFVAVALAVAAIIVATIVVGLHLLDRGWSASNEHPDPALSPPTSSLRSGGPGSLVSWDDIGEQGSLIVNSGPNAAAVSALTGQSARDPIRVYVGLASAPTYAERSAIAVNELQRTGAADRELLIVASPTGTGWLDSQALDGAEYIHGGDTAMVAVQYDDKPSWRSRVFNPDAPAEGASAQFYSVYSWWSALPVDHRPQLVVYGLSLGSYAMQSAFPDLGTLLQRSQGAIFAGTPSGTALWTDLTARRDADSPFTLPELDQGHQVRWFADPAGFSAPDDDWESPRIAYLQHGNDPVTWLTPSIFWKKPDWLQDGQRSPAVSSDMHWIPLVTGLQALIDFTMGSSVPDDSGHKYGTLTLEAWIAVTGDGGLSDDALSAIRATIASYDTIPPVNQ